MHWVGVGGACTGRAWGVHTLDVHWGSMHWVCMGGPHTGCAWGVLALGMHGVHTPGNQVAPSNQQFSG